jgi:osmotically-inducible protein OsmY
MNSNPRVGHGTARRVVQALVLAGLLGSALSACAPLIVGGAALGGALVAIDRRSTGSQVDDQSIEFKVPVRIEKAIGDRGHVNATSYNRLVLLSGEVPSDADKVAAEEAATKVENVRGIFNELAVTANSSASSRANDVLVTTKVKATLVDAPDIVASAYKVVTERGIVYLMGRVSEREATRAANLIRTVPGVQRVVRVFEILSEDDLARLRTSAPTSGNAKPAPAASAPAQ